MAPEAPSREDAEAVATCPLCEKPVLDVEWLLSGPDLMAVIAAMAGHFQDAHPDEVGLMFEEAEAEGLLTPPPA
jgi:hypothetical protein